MKLCIIITLTFNFSFLSELKSQAFLNGSFEINTVTNCMLDISNATFNSKFSDVKAIGNLQTIDIFYFSSCPIYDSAQNGNYFVDLESFGADSGTSTAISLNLSDTLFVGNYYAFSFYDKMIFPSGIIPSRPIEIGVSNNDTSFGSLIFTTIPADTVWTKRIIGFTSPVNGKYITTRHKIGAKESAGEFIDNFSFDTTTNFIDEVIKKENIEIYPNPNNGKFQLHCHLLNEGRYTLGIYSVSGQRVHEQALPKYSGQYSIETQLGAGVYFYVLQKDGAPLLRKKLVVMR